MTTCSLCGKTELRNISYCDNCKFVFITYNKVKNCFTCGSKTEQLTHCSRCRQFFRVREGINELFVRGD